jgi:predicted RNase H-like HicB family nuclease
MSSHLERNLPVNPAITFNILIKQEDGEWVAHCLELDIVAVAQTPEAAKEEIFDLIDAQLSYAFRHDNLAHFYHPAPASVWEEYYKSCENKKPEVVRREISMEADDQKAFVPPWIIANMCSSEGACHV